MTAAQFAKKWAASAGKEAASYQEHFVDLCRLLNERTPNEEDPSGTFYAFQKGAKKPDGDGFADVWLAKRFAWEYKTKKKHKTLEAAYKQVQTYREALGNPPLLVVCDFDRFEVHTNWTYTESWIYRFRNADILSDEPVQVDTIAGGPAKDAPSLTALQVLKALFENPERLKPQRTTDEITQDAARLFGEISDWLREWNVADMRIARFITKVMFCMFATDVGLLPTQTFSDVIAVHKTSGDNKGFRKHLAELFKVMREGGSFSMRPVPYFDGQLFEDSDVPDKVTTKQILTLAELDDLNWADVEPSIFGTLFVRILDPAQRNKLGAVYTSRTDIELIIEPVLMAPLRREWERVREEAETLMDPHEKKGKAGEKKAASSVREFHEQLATIRILDPACGSGNFLYVSLALLKALEKEVMAFAGLYGVSLKPRVHPRQLHGIETNPYAHELASIVIWIGYLQWKHRNAMPLDDEEPILEPLDQVELLDAVLDLGGKSPREPEWPEAHVIVGNPPFLGGKKLRSALGDKYVERLFTVWDGRVPREADFCCYWFEKARAAIETGRAKRVGLLATQAIRGGKNRRVLERIKETGDIFYAQSDRKWIQDGVAVRVSMVGFDDGSETRRQLNENPDDDPEHGLERARPVEGINANLTGQIDLTKARRLKENLGVSFIGISMHGPFDVLPGDAKKMLTLPLNVNGRPNSDVVLHIRNAESVAKRARPRYVVYFPPSMTIEEAAYYEAPFEFVKRVVGPVRSRNRRKAYRDRWWIHGEPRPAMLFAIAPHARYIATPRVAKHRIFVWLNSSQLPSDALVVFARDDDYFFGVLHSHAHEIWARGTGTQLREVASGFRYTPTTCFETFPIPRTTAEQEQAIAAAARELNALRENWLNPEGLVSDKELKKRTLTNLYNERPTWLANAHRALDEAVLAAYGWDDEPEDMALLARLLRLNLEREPVD